jgi:hypothetical protein
LLEDHQGPATTTSTSAKSSIAGVDGFRLPGAGVSPL